MSHSIPPIWVISLQRSAERRSRMASHLGDLGLSFQFVDAVDGRALSAGELSAAYDPDASLRLLGRQLTPGELGCSLSHYEVYRRQIELKLDEVVVLEDDVLLDPSFVDIMRSRRFPAADWDLIHLHIGAPQSDPVVSLWGRQTFGAGHQRVKLSSAINGTFGYLLKKSGAEKLLKHAYPVRVPSDLITGGVVGRELRFYGVLPALVTHAPGESTMPEAYPFRPDLVESEHGFARREARMIGQRAVRLYQRVSPFASL